MIAASCTIAHAEDSNRNQVRQTLENGWTVVYGKNFTEGDWIEGTRSIAESVAVENPGPFLRWFGNAMQENYTKIQNAVPGAVQRDIERWILDSLRSKRIIQYSGFQIEAGFVTYNRWQRTVHHEPRPKMKYVKYPWGGGMHVPDGVEMVKVENKVPLPNWHQFYIRYKLVPGSNPSGGQNPQSPDFQTGGVRLINNYSNGYVDILIFHPADFSRPFMTVRLQQGETRDLYLNHQRVIAGSDWRTQIVFGNGVQSHPKAFSQVSRYQSGTFSIVASDIYTR